MAGLYCTDCGFDNVTSRGACIMCLNMLAPKTGGQSCGNCATDNPRRAAFCGNCGTALAVGVVQVLSSRDLAARVLDAVGGYTGGQSTEDSGAFGGIDDMAGLPAASAAKDDVDVEAVPRDAIPGPILDSEFPEEEEPEDLGVDMDFSMPPPGVVEPEAAEDFAPPPPPGALSAEPAAPPPPPGPAEGQDGSDEEGMSEWSLEFSEEADEDE